MAERKYCNQPDRDVPGLVCGYPLPCPYHTVILNLKDKSIEIPHEANIDARKLKALRQIAEALSDEGDPNARK